MAKQTPELSSFEWQSAILDKDLNIPPESPAKGDRYIVGSSPTGDWTGQTGNIAYWDGISWIFITKKEGMFCWVKDEDKVYRYNGTSWSIVDSGMVDIVFVIDGGGNAITTGQKGHLEIPFACTITGWTLVADQSGSIVIDVWKDTYANFPPTVADTIAGSEKPTLSSAQKNQDLSLTTWTTSVSAGDILAFNVDSVATVTRVTLSIRAIKS